MDHQDWTTVTLRRKPKDQAVIVRDPERTRLAKIESMEDTVLPKKRIHPESIQALIRKRIELSLNQEKADQKCSFSKHTFKELEANRLIPNQTQQSMIQKHFGIQLKIELIH